MNERMLALYRQAQVPDTAIDPSNNMPYETTRFSADKFAELIVQECVIRAEREWIRNGSDTEHNRAITSVIKSIKEHFGVEE